MGYFIFGLIFHRFHIYCTTLNNICTQQDHIPFLFGELPAGNVKEKRENKSTVVASPQQFADSVECQRQNTTDKTARSTLKHGVHLHLTRSHNDDDDDTASVRGDSTL